MKRLLLALCLLPLLAPLAPTTVSAQCKPPNCFGAIAYDRRTGRAFWTVDFGNAANARSVAARSCGGRCGSDVYTFRGCGALFASRNGGLGVAEGPTRAQAMETARLQCTKRNRWKCHFKVAQCNAGTAPPAGTGDSRSDGSKDGAKDGARDGAKDGGAVDDDAQ